VEGDTALRTGTGFVIESATELDSPPPGDGLTATMESEPVAERSCGVSVTVSSPLLAYDVDLAAPLTFRRVPSRKFEPATVKVVAPAPTTTLEGERFEIAGFGLSTSIAAEVLPAVSPRSATVILSEFAAGNCPADTSAVN
jgi:hypothetical protein